MLSQTNLKSKHFHIQVIQGTILYRRKIRQGVLFVQAFTKEFGVGN